MRKLILIKHARPHVEEEIPSRDWHLSETGRAACEPLAERIRPLSPTIVVTSDEPKASETGSLVAARLGVPTEIAPGLHEHDRTNVPLLRSRDFISMMALFFRDRDRLVLGRETADQALRRIETAIDAALARHPEGNLAVVTHGTVLALFAASRAAGDAFHLWRNLDQPSMIVFELPACLALEVVPRISDESR